MHLAMCINMFINLYRYVTFTALVLVCIVNCRLNTTQITQCKRPKNVSFSNTKSFKTTYSVNVYVNVAVCDQNPTTQYLSNIL